VVHISYDESSFGMIHSDPLHNASAHGVMLDLMLVSVALQSIRPLRPTILTIYMVEVVMGSQMMSRRLFNRLT